MSACCRGLCSKCLTAGPTHDTLEERKFQFVPIWGIVVYFLYAMRRIDCAVCERVIVEAVPWAKGKERCTTSFAWFLARWAKRMSWKEVAVAFGVSWDTVYAAVTMAVAYGREHQSLDGVTEIGVDEVMWRSGRRKFLTVVYQINEGARRLLWIGRDRKQRTLEAFFRWFGRERARGLQAVASDMWQPYLNVIAARVPWVLNVLDRFHITANVNKAVDKVRAQEARTQARKGTPVLKHTRWLLLRSPETLKKKHAVSLAKLLKLNLKTVRAYLLKEELRKRSAVDFAAFYKQRVPAANGATGELLVISTDGKGISMRREDLRELTRKAAEQRRSKLAKRLSKGEKTATRRMAQVATVYSVDPFVRTPEQVAGTLGPDASEREPSTRPRPENKRVWASITEDAFDVIGDALEEAERRDPNHQKTWLILVDGGEHQLRCIRQWLRKKRICATIIVDIIHVLEYIWAAAHAFFAESTPELEDFVTERLLRVLQGKASYVAAGMRRSATLQGLTREQRRPIDKCANYLLKYAQYMRYDQYLAAGYPIATGVIEGACRYLVKDRMDLTGARWSLAGAEAVLRLRALRASGDFDDYWTFHEAQELERNHRKFYANHVALLTL